MVAAGFGIPTWMETWWDMKYTKPMVTAGFGQVGKTHSYCGFLVFQLGWNLVGT